jgi:hypothetical protein
MTDQSKRQKSTEESTPIPHDENFKKRSKTIRWIIFWGAFTCLGAIAFQLIYQPLESSTPPSGPRMSKTPGGVFTDATGTFAIPDRTYLSKKEMRAFQRRLAKYKNDKQVLHSKIASAIFFTLSAAIATIYFMFQLRKYTLNPPLPEK